MVARITYNNELHIKLLGATVRPCVKQGAGGCGGGGAICCQGLTCKQLPGTEYDYRCLPKGNLDQY